MGLLQAAEVGRLVETYFEALESDFQHYYGIDLRDACYGSQPVGLRRLRALIAGLPPGSAIHRAIDPEGALWSYSEDLLLLLAKLVDHGNRLQHAATQKTPVPKPLVVRRPGERVAEAERRVVANSDEVRTFFKRVKK